MDDFCKCVLLFAAGAEGSSGELTSSRDDAGAAAVAAAAAAGLLGSGQLDEGYTLVSDPEPAWITPDWRQRIVIARSLLSCGTAAAACHM